jgi:hypothetical protein
MKKLYIFFLSFFMMLVFSFNSINAQPLNEDSEKLSQIKEIRQSIKHHLKTNEKLETQIMKKSRQIEKLLVKLPQDSHISQEVIDNELTPKLEGIMTELMQIGEYGTASWEHLKKGNNQIKNKKYNAGIKNLQLADKALQNKHELLERFNEDLDSFLLFLKSLQHK